MGSLWICIFGSQINSVHNNLYLEHVDADFNENHFETKEEIEKQSLDQT